MTIMAGERALIGIGTLLSLNTVSQILTISKRTTRQVTRYPAPSTEAIPLYQPQ